MTSQANSEVRMVRCPKCRHILRELVEVPIYQCGGCGAILEAKKRGKDLQGTGSQANEADSKHKNEVESTSENHITEESVLDELPTRVDSTTDDRIESLGEIEKSSQLYGADAITCHESEGSSTEARARTEEEEGELPLYQYGVADQDKDSEINDLNEILSFSELNQNESNSLAPQDHNHESESFLPSLEIRTQSRDSSSEFNCDGEKEVSENDSENATEKSSAGIETEISELNQNESNSLASQDHNHESESFLPSLEKRTQSRDSSSEFNCDGEKEVSENDSENATEKSSAGIETEISELNQNESNSLASQDHNHESESFLPSLEKRTQSRDSSSEFNCDGEKEVSENDSENATEKSSAGIETEISELNQNESNSLASQDHNHESESFLPSLEKRTQSRDSSSEFNCDGEKEVSENDSENATEKSSAGIETEISELNQNESNSLASQDHNHESESFLPSLEKRTQSRDSSSEFNCDGEKEVSENDSGNATEKSSAGIETEISELSQNESNSLASQDHNHESESFLPSLEIRTQSRDSSSEFNCDGEKEVSENDSETATEKSSAGIETEISELSQNESNSLASQDHNHESESFLPSLEKRTQSRDSSSEFNCDGEKEVSENDSENATEKSSAGIETEISELSQNESNSLASQDHNHESESFLPSLEKRTQSRDSSSEFNCDGEKEVSENDSGNATEKSSAGIETEISELNQNESNSLASQDHNHESESFLPSLEIRTQSRDSSSEFNCDGEKEVSENDSENATEKSSAGIETEISGSLEDNCDGGKKEFENELQNTSENPSTDTEELEEENVQGKSSADGMRESIGSVNPTSSHEIADLLLESIAPAEADKFEISHNQSSTEAHNYNSEYDDENSGEVSISNKVLSSPKLNHLENDSSALGCLMHESGESLSDDAGKNERPSQVEEVDENRESLSILTSAKAESFLDDLTKDQIITADSFSSEGISLENPMSDHREMQQVEGGIIPGFQRVSSDDTLINMSHFYAKGDLGVTLRSLTARKYYAYDGSASGNETGDQVPHRRFQLSKGSSEDVGPNSTKVLPERSEYIMNHVTSNESELQRQPGSSLQGKKYSTTKVSRWHQEELLVSARYRSPVRNRMRDETDDCRSRVLFSRYSSQADQRSSSSSNYGQKEFFALPDNPHELHRQELLRMVYELQDQLKKTQLSEEVPYGRFLTRPWKGKEHHFAENRKDYSDLAYHDYHGECRRDITWQKNRELPRMVLPEDPRHYMHRVDCSCLRCCSQKQYHSAQQPPHAIYYSEEQSMTNTRQTSRPYGSVSSIPHHYATNEFSLRSQDMKNDQWYNKNKEARIHHIAKRHFQPIAGGAPIVACYHCSEMLQLPAESLLFKRRCHQLKCGACSKVLKFSLENKIHVVQYDPIPRNPLPSVIADRESDHAHAEPAASSSNSQSFSRNYSTGDNFSATYSSTSSFKTPKEGIKSKSKRGSVYKNQSFVESFRSARSSFITPDSEHSSSESEVESPVPGSALHKLMGYSSIRRLVFQ